MKLDEITIYQKALDLYKEIMNLHIPDTWVHYSQLMRAAASVVANIAEGYGRYEARYTDRSQRNFLAIANGSLWELIAWLDIALIDNITSRTQIEALRHTSELLSDMVIDEATKPRFKGIEVPPLT